jgi:hypothetical protein
VVHVFDVSQTEGEPLPDLAAMAGDPGNKLDVLESLVRRHGVQLEYDDLPNGAEGVSEAGKIIVRPDLSAAETFAVLVHEFAHELLHQRTGRKREVSRTTRETEAEAVAHVVCRAIGIDSTARTSDYIQLYRGDTEALGESLDQIQKASAIILDGIAADSSRPIPKAA